MSDEDEIDEFSQLQLDKMPALNRKGNVSFQVSGWDDDDEGVEEERNADGSTEKKMLWAAEKGHMDVLIKLLQEDSTLVQVKDKDGYTPLHRACYNNHHDIVRFLLKSGARHDAETIDHWQPLHSACRWNNVKCAAILLAFGADVNATSQGGVTPLHLAAGHKDGKDLIKLFLSHPDLISDAKDISGDTPLDLAFRSGFNHVLFEALEPCFL